MYALSKETTTILAQRDVELSLLHFLKKSDPDVYSVWRHHSNFIEDKVGLNGEDVDCVCARTPSGNVTSGEKSFFRGAHIGYAKRKLQNLPSSSQGLYSSRPWLVYWCLQTADLLGITDQLFMQVPADSIADFLYSCLKEEEQTGVSFCSGLLKTNEGSSDGDHFGAGAPPPCYADGGATDRNKGNAMVGFAGGPSCQVPHLITSYAACCALAILGKPAYLAGLPRAAIKRWLRCLRNGDGSFRVHRSGESDIRASYCAAVITALLCLDDPATWESPSSRGAPGAEGAHASAMPDSSTVRDSRVLNLQTALFVASCQTHEGGFACGTHAAESHGAYTQCGLAALLLMKQPHLIQHTPMRRWLAARQLSFEGGFNGRTNKLVDSCYSYWVGASHVLLGAADSYSRLWGVTRRELCARSSSLVGIPPNAASRCSDDFEENFSLPCLRAKEVLLLDYAQLVDVEAISCCDETVCDTEEEKYQRQQSQLKQFLSVHDDGLRESLNIQRAKKRIALNFKYSATQPDQQPLDEIYPDFDSNEGDFLFSQLKLQRYVLQCCQDENVGGFMDKPHCAHDPYHTCYALTGLSLSQNLQYINHARSTSSYVAHAFRKGYIPGETPRKGQASPSCVEQGSYGVITGMKGPSAETDFSPLRSANPLFNIHQSRVLSALSVWGMKRFV